MESVITALVTGDAHAAKRSVSNSHSRGLWRSRSTTSPGRWRSTTAWWSAPTSQSRTSPLSRWSSTTCGRDRANERVSDEQRVAVTLGAHGSAGRVGRGSREPRPNRGMRGTGPDVMRRGGGARDSRAVADRDGTGRDAARGW